MGRLTAISASMAGLFAVLGWSAGWLPPPAAPIAVAAAQPVRAPAQNTIFLQAADDAPKKRRYVVAAMGDSLTDPKSHGGKYLELLRKRCPKSRFDSYGVGGNMVNQMRARFARDILGLPKKEGDAPKPSYTHVIVLGGINDICSDESANRTNDKIKDDLQKMYRMAQAANMAVIAITMPPWAGFTRYYNDRRAASTLSLNRWIRQQVKTADVDSVFDVYPIMSCGDPEFLCEAYGWPDKVHWNKKGHEVAGDALHAHDFSDCE